MRAWWEEKERKERCLYPPRLPWLGLDREHGRRLTEGRRTGRDTRCHAFRPQTAEPTPFPGPGKGGTPIRRLGWTLPAGVLSSHLDDGTLCRREKRGAVEAAA